MAGFYPPISKQYSNDLQNLVKSLLLVDPSKRPNTEQILNLPIIWNLLSNTMK